ncbi:MAG: ATP-binding cassette domain-containing protein, partial [Gaiellaceae bacterium]
AWEAARIAGLARDIEELPMGMQTFVSEGAGSFSGGQRQRLLIARAVVGRPRILLFDEATSALDNRTQQDVAEAIERLRATRIVIAHRLSTVRRADKIVVLVAGRVAQDGTYDELLEVDGPFRRLAQRQLA